jgi:trimethylamine:corrinoid methyltransferase-like protein
MDRRSYEVWQQTGDGPRDWARKEARKRFDTHQPEALDPKIQAELSRIISSLENRVSHAA